VAFHEAGHAVDAWLIRLDVQVIAVMDEYGYVAGEHVHEAKCLGVVKHSIIHSHDLGRLRDSKSGVVGRGALKHLRWKLHRKALNFLVLIWITNSSVVLM
ncbi:hypothetical protein ACSHJO_005111, partial [Escherichia coli]